MRDDWTEATLGELTASTRPICYGVLKPGPFVEGGIPLVRITDMDCSLLGPQGMHLISPELDNEFRRSRLSGNEVLLSIQGTVGRVARCAPELAGANISRTIAVIDCDERLLNELLALFLESLAVNKAFNSSGSTRDSLNISEIRLIKVPLPPIAEQKRIVDVVSSVDAYIDALQQQVDAARTARNAVLHELLTAGGDNWTETTLGEVAQWSSGGTPQSGESKYYDGDIPWCVIGDLTEGEVFVTEKQITQEGLQNSSAKIVQPGAVMIAMYGASIGRTGLVAVPMATNQAIACAIPNVELLDNLFLLIYLQTQKMLFVEAGQGAAQPNISQTVLKRWPIPLPPIAEQERIVEIVSSMDDVIQTAESAVVEAKNLRSGLLSDLLSGEHEIPVSYDELLGAA